MTWRALLSALGLWSREAKAALLANLGFTAIAALLAWPLTRLPSMAAWGLGSALSCAFFLSLIRVLRGLDRGEGLSLRAWAGGLKGSGADAFPSALLLMGTLAAGSAAAGGAPFGAGLFGLAVWLGLGALLSLGLAAPEGQPWWAAAWAGLLAAVAFLPAALAAVALLSWLGGFWALWLGPDFRGAGFFWAPLLLAPFFTPSFYAAYLYYLAQGIKDRSQGKRPLDQAPTLKEILKPWR
jgi:hypothetical protein